MKIESGHIKEWLNAGRFMVVSANVAALLVARLESLRWSPSGTGLDWVSVNNTEANFEKLKNDEILDWIQTTAFKDDTHLIFLFDPGEPCIACDLQSGILMVDQVFWKAPGRRFIFGAKLDGTLQPEFNHIAEYNGSNLLVAMA